jgi:mRNA interferase MazF
VFCPITHQVKGYPFEVLIPRGLSVSGAVLADQLKSLDWRARGADLIGKLPASIIDDILAKARALL